MRKFWRNIKKIFSKITVPVKNPKLQHSMKDIINANFEKIQEAVDQYRITIDILIEESKRRDAEIGVITKALKEINDRLKSLEPD